MVSRHKQELHGTNRHCTAQTKTSRHKQKLSRHKRKLHGTKKISHGGNGCIFTRAVTQSLKIWRNRYDFELRKEDEDSEESLIRYYFFRGFECKEIILLLLKNHNIEMSLSTLKRRIKKLRS